MNIKQISCILALAIGTSAAHAGILYDHMTGIQDNGASGIPPATIATSFSTGSLCPTGCTLGDITLWMTLDEDADASDITLGLYADGGSIPGSLIANLITPSSIGDDLDNAVFTHLGSIILGPTTNYWLMLSADSGIAGAGAEWARGPSGQGNFVINDPSFPMSGSNSPFMYKVEADVSNVPVPAAIWLMTTALSGLAVRARRAKV
jgi:hypothetical protein